MEHGSGRKAVIVGGSVGGLFAATALRAAGWDVGVFEQSRTTDSRGGGIVLQPPIERAFAFGNVPLPREAAVDSIDRIYVDAHDRIVQRFTMPQTQTAWNVIYTALKRALPAGIVHAGDAFERFEQDGERIVAHFASGHAETADLLIGADGGRSAVRAQLMPDVRPTYAGYVAWRRDGRCPNRCWICCASASRSSKATRICSSPIWCPARTARSRPASGA